ILVGSGSGNVIKGNYVGTDAAGTTGVANLNGIVLSAATSNDVIGDVTGALPNVVAFNSNAGVLVNSGSAGNQIVGNSTHDNGTLGIDLNGDGVTANDAG